MAFRDIERTCIGFAVLSGKSGPHTHTPSPGLLTTQGGPLCHSHEHQGSCSCRPSLFPNLGAQPVPLGRHEWVDPPKNSAGLQDTSMETEICF